MKITKIKDATQRAMRAHDRRRPWMLPLLLGVVALAGALARNRGLMRREARPGRSAIRLVEQPTPQYREQVASGRSPTGNGVVRADHPSAGSD